ncbi:MAG TPA: ribokinase [Clostridiaceae bacterium]|jgi:ribokinase|nr:ribokinase [Clostridiaceae bacterium]HBF77864.1 ribokinase [Clostridiaceae bacterium]HBG39440.1 ribokinase [Clostridiaceae bacterium]HBN29166.1 ribokinase [Clostridiaceae bacterium]HBX49231.1 ribokinase [Clostridiaceae bacterium]
MRLCVVGSLNMDIVLNVNNLPKKGETILSDSISRIPGGKGANQAVSAARLGCDVHMIGKIGADESGAILLDALKKEKIDTEFVYKDVTSPTGTAIIPVDKDGNNSIIVVPGSNMEIQKEDIRKAEDYISKSDAVVTQFETPVEAAVEAFSIAKSHNVFTVLNPAPARETSDELLKLTDIIIPNETEVMALTGVRVTNIESAVQAGKDFLKHGVKVVIVTMGDKGATIVMESRSGFVPAYKVKAVDTTAAGDCFIGAFVSKLSSLDYETVLKATDFACRASSIAVSRKGAQPSLPYLDEVEKYF